MKKNIKVKIDNTKFTQKEFDKILDSKNTINLTNKISTKQALKNRQARTNRKLGKSFLKLIFLPILILITILSIGLFKIVSADNTNPEYNYYGVDNYRDYARSLRIEACYRTGTQILGEVTQKQINHCATSMTLITAFESDFGSSRRCIEDNNCMGLKGVRSNGSYGFLTFENQYKGNLYFAEKWFTFHYKKSIHTLIFGYKQKDGTWRFGWSTTDKVIYYNFMRNNYYRVLNEIEKIKD